ncbi:glycoside hydrolase family 5 protein [Bifidobacterium aesculapii]|uniref:glycoside hydrolase family 5 protein n=1 Tax=Bifidobacterium aesculapii TaxID=1329411 RepID=UPI00128F2FA8|nr:cellulase family glycosylhydrolase [Bifidobacterium aesculapii]
MTLGIDERIDGVNLGGWLVLERWMTPELFRESGEEDEIRLHRATDPEALERLLRHHRDTYITHDDFRAIAAHGCNLVCIPVPYFVFGDVPGHPGCVEWLDKAFDWAEGTGLKVLIDLHTVPGSQNGFDNGGLTGVVRWHRSPRQVAFALDVLTRLARRYCGRDALFGIEVLNEPVDWFTYVTSPSSRRAKDRREAHGSGHVPLRFLKRFYREAYRRLRPVLGEDRTIVFHDGFRLDRWRDWFAREGMRNVMLDTHMYLVMSERPETVFRMLPDTWLVRWYRLFAAWQRRRIRRAARFIPVMVGEWCVANGLAARIGDGSDDTGGMRSAGSGDVAASPSERRRAICREVAALQLDAWNISAGQVYWSYRLRARRIPADDARFDPWDLTHVWHAGWLGL